MKNDSETMTNQQIVPKGENIRYQWAQFGVDHEKNIHTKTFQTDYLEPLFFHKRNIRLF